MPTPAIHDSAGKANAEQGVVLLDGPDGATIAMTADAAEHMAQALIRAAAEARKQISRLQ